MIEVYVLDDTPFGTPQYTTHAELASLCIGASEKRAMANAPRSEWHKTAGSLRELAAGVTAISESRRLVASNLYAGCIVIAEKLPTDNPELRIILGAMGRAFDAEQTLSRLIPEVERNQELARSATRTLLRNGIRGVSLEDIELVKADRSK